MSGLLIRDSETMDEVVRIHEEGAAEGLTDEEISARVHEFLLQRNKRELN